MAVRDAAVLADFIDKLLLDGYSAEKLDEKKLSPEMQEAAGKLNRLNRVLGEFMDCAKQLSESCLQTEELPENNPFSRQLKRLCESIPQVYEAGDMWKEAYLRAKEEESFLRRLICQDPVTELYNRRYCLQLMEEWESQQCPYSFCFLDLDHLKEVNDRFGHGEGDYYIKALAEVLKNGFRQTDRVCRIGGDEFAVLMKECPKPLAEERLKNAGEAFKREGEKHGRYPMNFSYGVEFVKRGEKRSACEIMEAADQSMYRFKRRYKAAGPD